MMQPRPWERYRQSGASAPQAPTFIETRPADPVRVDRHRDEAERVEQDVYYTPRRERRAERAEARQPGPMEAAEDRELERLIRRLELEKKEREEAAARRQAQLPGGGQATGDQSRYSGFALRMGRANQDYERFERSGVGAPSLGLTIARSVLPESLANSTLVPEDRQTAEALQRDWIAAALRYESGAAIPTAEIENHRRLYFPQPGDTEQTIRQKAELRRTAYEAMVASSGPMGSWVQEQVQGPQQQQVDGPDQQQFATYNPNAPREFRYQLPPNGGVPTPPLPEVDQSMETEATSERQGWVLGNDPQLTALNARSRDAFRRGASQREIVDMWRAGGLSVDQIRQALPSLRRAIQYRQANPGRADGVQFDLDDAWVQNPNEEAGPVERGIAAVGRGISNVAGAPVDLVNGTMRAIGVPVSETPVMGSEWLKDNWNVPGTVVANMLGGDYRARPLNEPSLAPQSDTEAWLQRGAEFAGGGAIPGMGLYSTGVRMAAGAPQSGNTVLAALQNAGTNTYTRPGIAALAEGGAALGGSTGVSVADTVAPGNQTIQSLLALAGGLGGGVAATAPFSGRAAAANPTYAAAERQGMTDALMPADLATPRGGIQRLTSGTAQTVGGGGTVAAGARRLPEAIGDRVTDIAGQYGNVERRERLGSATRQTLNQTNRELARDAREAYSTGFEENVRPVGAWRGLRTADEHIRELDLPGADANVRNAIQAVRNDLVDGDGNLMPLTVEAARRLRTRVREMAQTEGLRGTDFERRMGEVYRSIRRDIEQSQTPEGRQAFRLGDRIWADRAELMDDLERGLLGRTNNASDEAVARRVLDLAFNDSRGYARLMRVVGRENSSRANNIRAASIDRIGRANRSQQNAAEDVFSAETFLTNWVDLPARSRAAMLPDPAHRRAFEDFAQLASARREASRTTNYSNTSGGQNVGRLLSAGAGWSTAGASLILENLTAQMISSRALLNWAVRASRGSNPRRHIGRLEGIAAAEPAIAQDVLRLRDVLTAANDNLTAQAAASTHEREDRR